MRGFRYSYNMIGYAGEEVSKSIDRLARFGYDAVEVEGEPDKYDPKKVVRLAGDAGLGIRSVCPNFTAERDLSHPDPALRERAVGYIRRVAEFASALGTPSGTPLIIVAPTAYSRTRPIAAPRDEWRWAVESVRTTGEYAASLGVDLTLECWNRFGTYMLNRLDEGARMWRETGLKNGGIMADTFHMSIEERSVPAAIRATGDLLNHVHLADSNRLAPGLGHTDFEDILRALTDVGYDGPLTFELMLALPNRLGIDGTGVPEASPDDATKQAIKHLREVERRLAASGVGGSKSPAPPRTRGRVLDSGGRKISNLDGGD